MTEKILHEEMMSDVELDQVAGGGFFDFIGEMIVKPVVNKVVDVVETVVETAVEIVQANETHTVDYIVYNATKN